MGCYFYPRSPCGERQDTPLISIPNPDFYPRSPCGERHTHPVTVFICIIFLSTLSLRRATSEFWTAPNHPSFLSTLSLRRATVAPVLAVGRTGYFYPRSPCGERHDTSVLMQCQVKFLSTLSLRRATFRSRILFNLLIQFLSTLSLRRATVRC